MTGARRAGEKGEEPRIYLKDGGGEEGHARHRKHLAATHKAIRPLDVYTEKEIKVYILGKMQVS